jgi:hypothetical protein
VAHVVSFLYFFFFSLMVLLIVPDGESVGPFFKGDGLARGAFERKKRLQGVETSFDGFFASAKRARFPRSPPPAKEIALRGFLGVRYLVRAISGNLFPAPFKLQRSGPVGETADVAHAPPRFASLDTHRRRMRPAFDRAIVLS